MTRAQTKKESNIKYNVRIKNSELGFYSFLFYFPFIFLFLFYLLRLS